MSTSRTDAPARPAVHRFLRRRRQGPWVSFFVMKEEEGTARPQYLSILPVHSSDPGVREIF